MRNTFVSAFASAILALSCLDAAPARAQSIVTYVSGKGVDSGSCTPQSSPCRSFAYALTQTSAGGEIKALDPDGYGPVTITQSVSIIGVEGASINRTSGNHIFINAGPNDAVTIANLILDGDGAAQIGIWFNSGGSLTIKNCVAQNFYYDGIYLAPSGPANFLIADVVATANGDAGIVIVSASTSGAPLAALDHVLATKNVLAGVAVATNSGASPLYVTAVDSIASDNVTDGFVVTGATLRLTQSTAAQNGGYGVNCGGTCQSAGNNLIYGNAASTQVSGTLTNVGTQ